MREQRMSVQTFSTARLAVVELQQPGQTSSSSVSCFKKSSDSQDNVSLWFPYFTLLPILIKFLISLCI